jgi:hypothetical protein
MPVGFFGFEAADNDNVMRYFDVCEGETSVFDVNGGFISLSDVHKPNEDTLTNNEHQ